jgi:ATP-dependent exoDNAse (exonuclease V) alpha subunit
MNLKNKHEKKVYNGDLGEVVSIDLEEKTITITFDGVLHIFDHADLSSFSLAYAMTIHKSQGSEYPAVVIPITMQVCIASRHVLQVNTFKSRHSIASRHVLQVDMYCK